MVGPDRIASSDILGRLLVVATLHTLALNCVSWKRWSLYRQRAGAKKTLQWIVLLSNIERGRGVVAIFLALATDCLQKWTLRWCVLRDGRDSSR